MNMQLFTSKIFCRFARLGISTALIASSFTGALSAHAEDVTATPLYAVSMALEAGGEKSSPRVLAKAGEQFAVASGEWRIEMTVRQGKMPTDVWLTSKIFKGSNVVSTPNLMAHLNEKAAIKVGDTDDPFSLSMVISPQP
jgi:hypothetical protein